MEKINTLTLITASFPYVTSVPYFWPSMGFTTAVAMLSTAMLFDHNVKGITRAFIAKCIFILMLFSVTYVRINYTLKDVHLTLTNRGQPFAGLVTLTLTALFWLVGVLLAVIILKVQRKLR